MSDATFGFTLPDTLPTDPAALHELRAAAIEAYERANPGEGVVPTPEQLDEMKTIVAALDKIDAALATAEEAAAEHAALNERVYATADETEAETPDPEAEPEAPAEAETAEFADDTTDTETDTPAPADTEQETTVPDTDSGAVFAGSGRAARRRATDHAPKTTDYGYQLDGNAPDYTAEYIDSGAVAERIGRMLSGSRTAGARIGSSFAVATLDRQIPAELIGDDETTAELAADYATDETRLTGNSLVAAGGWCSPSETVYSFLGVPAAGDLLDLPEISVSRGGVKFPKEPSFAEIYEAYDGFHQTEAKAIAGETKDCYEIPCGDFEELRLDVVGLCITSGILQAKAWPEQIRRYVDGIMKGHQHRISALSIDKIVDGSTKVSIPSSAVLGAAGAILNSVELGAEDVRTKHRLPYGTTVEGVAPTWVKPLIRADLAYRTGVGFENVTDEMINAHFATRRVRLQFVSDWQTSASGLPGASTPITGWPGEVKIALYPAGTWVRNISPVIELGVTYGLDQLKQNKRTELFTEDGLGVAKRGPESRVYTVPVDVAGYEGLRVDLGGPVADGDTGGGEG